MRSPDHQIAYKSVYQERLQERPKGCLEDCLGVSPMRPTPPQGRIRPRISTMPRQQSEASLQLDLYKLAVEKKRLEQELKKIEQRRHQIHQRLSILDKQIVGAEERVQQLREPPVTVSKPIQKIDAELSETYNTLLLEY